MEQELEERQVKMSRRSFSRPSMLVERPTYSINEDDTTTARRGNDNPYNDMSSFDESYSGSSILEEEEEEESFNSETSNGILSPEEIDKQEKQNIARKEHQRVFRARIFVLLLLMITSVSNALIVYFLTYNREYEDYQRHYNELATEIFQVTQQNVRVAFTSMSAMSLALTNRVLDDPDGDGSVWPMVTFPDFPILTEAIRNVSGAIQVTFAPIVNENQRLEWEHYTVDHQAWLTSEEQIEYYRNRRLRRRLSASSNSSSSSMERVQQQASPAYTSASDSVDVEALRYPTQQLPQVNQSSADQEPSLQSQRRQQYYEEHNYRGVVPERIHPAPTREERLTPGIQYAPVWQMSPPPYYRGIINHDLYREPTFQRLVKVVNDTRQAVISNLLNDDLVELLLEDHNSEENYLVNPPKPDHGKKYPPCSVMIQPVWDDLGINNPNLAGYLIALIPWEAYLLDTFRPGTEGSALARYEESDCDSDSMLNYKLQGGQKVFYLGDSETFPGYDNFDYSLDSEMYFPTQPAYTQAQFLVETNATTADEVVEEASLSDDKPQPSDCSIEIYLFPSRELRDLYMTNWPTYYALMVCATFVVLSLAFFLYDLVVERRRGRVMAVAEKTGRIVTNLFPGQFADQLIAENKKKEKDAKKNKKKKVVIEEAPTRQLKKFMKDRNANSTMDCSADHPLGYGEATPDEHQGGSPLFLSQSKPIADLFPDTTVLFADIAGFTAWSSVREPSQVFTLLETVYQNFDYLAKQYGVFKIETIGDCYVAVCGLPEPRADHAVAMSRFALACMQKMKALVSQLEVTLGPDTGDLTMRFGLHSGPVTAGVLRGERARFQLFGDTVNTAARMESTGMRDKIQISQETADLLIGAGKVNWFTKRDGLVTAKGKGELQTYWLASTAVGRRTSMEHRRGSMQHRRRHSMGGRSAGVRHASGEMEESSKMGMSQATRSNSGRNLLLTNGERPPGRSVDTANTGNSGRIPSEESQRMIMDVTLTKKQQRLVDWNCELLAQIVRQIVARRNFLKNVSTAIHRPFMAIKELPTIGAQVAQQVTSSMPLDEVVEVINLPDFDVAAYHGNTDAKHIKLEPSIVSQLRQFLTVLASRYRDNPFHNFEHASHVTMSVSKLLTRIVAPDLASINDRHDSTDIGSSSLHLTNDMKDLHDHTYGITSDPLTQLAVVMSALIHDADHRGVPNNILIKEEPEMAVKYRNKSVAEQNSVDVAWELFMDDHFRGLRETICPEYTELRRFRQIIVSSVMATDIFDPELSSLRKARWAKAFPPPDAVAPTIRPSQTWNSRPSLAMPSLKGNMAPSNLNIFNNQRDRNDINRKATIVIEHLIQASDVSHTMQHWHIYTKWNECLFKEMYAAYKDGRSDKDPADGWYKGEIWFFDNYVIPLAKKLKECGVFGVSSDEYLDYATANRNEWEEKGEAIVAEMMFKYKDARGRIDITDLGYE